MTDFYTANGEPLANSDINSAPIQNELAAVEAGFAKIAAYTSNGGKVVVINAGGTAQEAVASLTVAQGGSGRSTATTAYGLLAAGTTATGAHQTLAAGLTTEILVGGGASALPVWTAATGSGAPVRATSPTFVTPLLGTPTSGTLTNCTGLPAAGVTGTALVAAAIGTTIQAYDADLTTWAGITPGTGVATALAVNVGSTGAPVVNGGALGTPSSGTLTSCTGLPIGGITQNTARLLGRTTASAGVTEEITVGSGLSLSAGSLTATATTTIVGISGTIAEFNTACSDADFATTGANTFAGRQTLGENADIALDAALSADGKYTGIVQAGTAAVALAFGELCYKVTATGKWNKASGAAAGVGTVVATGQLGLCVLAASGDAEPTVMLMYGNCRADSLFDTFTVGAPLYMSAATAGKIVDAAPTGTTDFTVREVGRAEDANTIFFNPSNDYVTIDAASALKTVNNVAIQVASSAMTFLSAVTAANSATVDIETTFSSTYDAYLLVATGITPATNTVDLLCRMKIGGTYDTSNNYCYHTSDPTSVAATYSAVNAAVGSPVGFIRMNGNAGYYGTAAGTCGSFSMLISNPSSTALKKHINFSSSLIATSGEIASITGAGYNTGTAALTGLRFYFGAGNIATGTFRLYGIANN